MLPPTLKLCWWSPCISSGRGQLGIRTLGETLKSFLCEILSEAGKGGLGLRWDGRAPWPGREPIWVCACCDLVSPPILGCSRWSWRETEPPMEPEKPHLMLSLKGRATEESIYADWWQEPDAKGGEAEAGQ